MKYTKLSPLILVVALALSSQGAFAAQKIAHKGQKKSKTYTSASYRQQRAARPYQMAAVTSQTPPAAAAPAPAPVLATPSAGSLTAEVKPASKWIAAYYADFNGPAIGEWGWMSKSSNPGEAAPLWLYNVGLLGYKLNDTTRIQVQPRVKFQVVNPASISMMDTRVGFNFSKVAKLGPISVDGISAQVEIPTSDGAFKNNMIIGPRLTETVSAQWGRFGLSSYNIQRYRFYSNMANANWDIYFYPSATYEVASWLSGRVGYEYQFGQDGAGAPVSMIMSDLKAQAVLNISNTWSFEPYVKMFPWDGLYSDNTLVGFEVNGLFF